MYFAQNPLSVGLCVYKCLCELLTLRAREVSFMKKVSEISMKLFSHIDAVYLDLVTRMCEHTALKPEVIYRFTRAFACFAWVFTGLSTLLPYVSTRDIPPEFTIIPAFFLIQALGWGGLAKAAKSLMK
jgi:hypothetical protein